MDSIKAVSPFVLTAFIGLIIFLPAVFRYLAVRYRLRNFKGPRGFPILGNILDFAAGDNAVLMKTSLKWAEMFRENGSFLLYLGLTPRISVFNAVDLEKILRNAKHDEKGYFYKMYLSPWLGDGLLLSKGSKWVTRRKLLTPSFHFSILNKFLVVFNEQAQCLANKINDLDDQTAVNIPPLISLCSLDIMRGSMAINGSDYLTAVAGNFLLSNLPLTETIMGERLGAQKGEGSEYVEAVHRISKILVQRFRNPLYWNSFLFRLSRLGKDHAKCLRILHGTTKQVIHDRKLEIQKEGRNDVTIDDESREVRNRRRLAFLDLLIEVQKQDPSLTDEGIQEEVDTFMFEGHDTVSTSLTMAIYLIGRHPEVQKKIQEELDRVFGYDRERFVTSDDLHQLEYLSCVIKESQRLLTTVPFVDRVLEEDTRIGGVDVPKGVNVTFAFILLHRDPKQFPDPQKFDPDRFLPANSEGRHNFAFVPFSAGSRNCIGQKFAVMEEKVVLATLLRKFEVYSLQKLEDMRSAGELVLRPIDGVHVKFTRRP